MDLRAVEPDEAELSRAQGYLLLSTLLAKPPSEDFLRRLEGLAGDHTEWGFALEAVSSAARGTTAAAVGREFNRLFVGLGRGELMPYASYYITGFLQDRPLVAVRRDMAALGVARSPDVSEPEDHVAFLFEMMAGLIDGRFGEPASVKRQRAFFETHLAGWTPVFFRDLQAAEAAEFYRPVGRLGLVLLGIEEQVFELEYRGG